MFERAISIGLSLIFPAYHFAKVSVLFCFHPSFQLLRKFLKIYQYQPEFDFILVNLYSDVDNKPKFINLNWQFFII